MLVYATVFVCAYALALMVYRYDMYEKEPWYMLLGVVALGMAAAFGIGFVEDIAIESFNQHENAGGQAAIEDGRAIVLELAQLRGEDLIPLAFGGGRAHPIRDAVPDHDHPLEGCVAHALLLS